MIVWCKICGALIGLREPLNDWSIDRNGICPACAEKMEAAQSSEVNIAPKSNGTPESEA